MYYEMITKRLMDVRFLIIVIIIFIACTFDCFYLCIDIYTYHRAIRFKILSFAHKVFEPQSIDQE